jgi:hypothetical protein
MDDAEAWAVQNQRCVTLIRKSAVEALTEAEQAELQGLQETADRRLEERDWEFLAGWERPRPSAGAHLSSSVVSSRCQSWWEVWIPHLDIHRQHSPWLTSHLPARDVTVHGAPTLVTTEAPLHSHKLCEHTASVAVASPHTQHSPLPTSHLPVAEVAAQGPVCRDSWRSGPQLHVGCPHTATVCSCARNTAVSGSPCASPPAGMCCAQPGHTPTRKRSAQA